ncbi:hypothetical protein AAG906_033188 [Vitis piasezkii]
MDINKMGLTSSKATTEALDPFLYITRHTRQRCNDMVISWLLNSIHPDIANSVIYAKTTIEIWADLQERFSQGNNSRIYQIKRDIVEHRQGQQSISVYYTKLKAFGDELSSYHEVLSCSCRGLRNLRKMMRKRVMRFLMGLNDNNKATSTHQVQKQKTPLHCSYCDRDYHNIEKCYYLHGFPIGHKWEECEASNQRHSNVNNVKVETNKVVEIEAKFLPTSDGPRLTTEEYNQLMAMIQKNNGGNSQHFANATRDLLKNPCSSEDWSDNLFILPLQGQR